MAVLLLTEGVTIVMLRYYREKISGDGNGSNAGKRTGLGKGPQKVLSGSLRDRGLPLKQMR
jgi:hypothetical protein